MTPPGGEGQRRVSKVAHEVRQNGTRALGSPGQTGWVLKRRVLPIALLAAAAAVTVFAFWMFDHNSHSASDTIRPFLITTTPVWLVVGLSVQRLTRARRGG